MGKIIILERLGDGSIQLPQEVLAAFDGANKIYVNIDQERNLVALSVEDPEVLESNEALDRIAELNAGMSYDEYTDPVPDAFLKSGKTDNGSKGEG